MASDRSHSRLSSVRRFACVTVFDAPHTLGGEISELQMHIGPALAPWRATSSVYIPTVRASGSILGLA